MIKTVKLKHQNTIVCYFVPGNERKVKRKRFKLKFVKNWIKKFKKDDPLDDLASIPLGFYGDCHDYRLNLYGTDNQWQTIKKEDKD